MKIAEQSFLVVGVHDGSESNLFHNFFFLSHHDCLMMGMNENKSNTSQVSGQDITQQIL